MCLGKITKVYKPSLFNLWIPRFAYKNGVGWKVFKKDNPMYPMPNFINLYKGNYNPLPIGIWLNEEKYRCNIFKNHKFIDTGSYFAKDCTNYLFGWHILKEKPRFGHLHVKKQVEYKYGHTAGIDATYKAPTIVAKYMKILD